jgi:hypothetical protein
MPRVVVAAVLTCLTHLLAGCGCSEQKDRPSSGQSLSREDAKSAAEAATKEAKEREEKPRNPVMYGPHTDIVAVVLRTDPWLTVIGSDGPMLALYADRTVVYLAELPNEARWTYLEARLSEAEFDALKRDLGPTKEFIALEGFYDLAPNATDQPRTKIHLSDGKEAKAVSVRAYSSRAERSKTEEEWPGAKWPELYGSLGEFDRVYDTLAGLSGTDPHEWEPKYVELYVYGSWSLDEWRERYTSGSGFGSQEPYEDPPAWPEAWPKFNDPLAYAWSEDCYSLYVPGSALNEVRGFFHTRGKHGLVVIDGRVYCATWRRAFPGEGTYRDAFEEAEKQDNPHRLGL